MGKTIIKRFHDQTIMKGLVVKIINFENSNTLFLVDFEDGILKSFRLIYDLVRGDAWLDEEFEEIQVETVDNRVIRY